ncbi:hypothetical protein HHK36_023483 [Tetracentron sinense]|uniref:Uncharacterized protein n=1 Tax=Tetracentron sinense TaxID=13715 RepID=A0A834YMP9_TETSI|nr:hypothetical protein HHK36_023483 [Tetracentron sinense]
MEEELLYSWRKLLVSFFLLLLLLTLNYEPITALENKSTLPSQNGLLPQNEVEVLNTIARKMKMKKDQDCRNDSCLESVIRCDCRYSNSTVCHVTYLYVSLICCESRLS